MPCTPELGLGWGTVAAAVTELCVPTPTRALERLGLVGQAAVNYIFSEGSGDLDSL